MLNRRSHVVDVLEGLRQDDAIEAARRKRVRIGEIGDEAGLGVLWIDVEDIGFLDAMTKPARVIRIQHLEDPTANGRSFVFEKAFDVIAVDRSAAITAPIVTERRRSTERAEPRRTSYPQKPFPQRLASLLGDSFRQRAERSGRALYGSSFRVGLSSRSSERRRFANVSSSDRFCDQPVELRSSPTSATSS